MENRKISLESSTSCESTVDSLGEELFDPWCDPENPKPIQFQDVSAASFKIKSSILVTPCTWSHLSNELGMDLFFKKDFQQYTGSCRERGALYALMTLNNEERKKGVIAASGGNLASALCHHGHLLNIDVSVVLPVTASISKVRWCKQYAAEVIISGNNTWEAQTHAKKIAKEQGLVYIHSHDHPHILAGQGTMGLEIVEQVPNIDAVVLPVGTGGIIAGVALAVKSLYPQIKIIGVESEACPSFSIALQMGYPTSTKAQTPSLPSSLTVPGVGANAFATAASLIDKIIIVKAEWISIAILRLVEHEKSIVEGASAIGLAAVLAGQLPELTGKRVVIPLCDGNIDTPLLGRCLDRGLAADGRLVKFSVVISDRPGGETEVFDRIWKMGVSIKDIMYERAWQKQDMFGVELKLICETRNRVHAQELEKMLREKFHFINVGSWDAEESMHNQEFLQS